jgi:hypothetical protein
MCKEHEDLFVISVKLTEVCDYILATLRNQSELAEFYAKLFGMGGHPLFSVEIKNIVCKIRIAFKS